MLRFVVRRLLLLLPVAIGISVVVFVLIRFAPGDPVVSMLGNDYSADAADRLRHELGLDQPVFVQYWLWLERVVHGNFGTSIFSRQPVGELLLGRLPTTLGLAIGATAIAIVVAVPAGVVAARWRGTAIDGSSRILATLAVSVPVFWLGLMAIIVFGANLHWFPLSGGVDQSGWAALVMPCTVLACGFGALIMRMVRSNLIEVLGEDYVRTARAKGLHERTVYYRHALRNALIPLVTVVGLQFGTLLGGAVLTETVFSLPGLGRLLVTSINARDYPVVQGCVLVIALSFVIVNLVVDLIYALVDPRIRYS
jgi:peptide/nickel transport system permease protein